MERADLVRHRDSADRGGRPDRELAAEPVGRKADSLASALEDCSVITTTRKVFIGYWFGIALGALAGAGAVAIRAYGALILIIGFAVLMAARSGR